MKVKIWLTNRSVPIPKNFIPHIFPPFLPEHNLTKAKGKNPAFRRNNSCSKHFLAPYLPRKPQALELFHTKRLHPVALELKLCHGPVTFYKLRHSSWKISASWAKQIMIENGAILVSTIYSLPTCSKYYSSWALQHSLVFKYKQRWGNMAKLINSPPSIRQIIIGWNIFLLRVKLLLESINFRFTEAWKGRQPCRIIILWACKRYKICL